jgi:hypothetical protein
MPKVVSAFPRTPAFSGAYFEKQWHKPLTRHCCCRVGCGLRATCYDRILFLAPHVVFGVITTECESSRTSSRVESSTTSQRTCYTFLVPSEQWVASVCACVHMCVCVRICVCVCVCVCVFCCVAGYTVQKIPSLGNLKLRSFKQAI